MSAVADFKYRAFLSYAHADTGWAKWLHGRLETFRIDKDMVGRATPLGPVPRKLRPIFRDRDDFTGGHSLGEATVAALDASAAIVVLCSLRSAQSKYVNEEIRLFRWRHPERPVIPVMIDGTFPDNFPPALLFEVTADGMIEPDRPITLLGPDLREDADGKGLGLAKVVAGLTGVGSDDVFRRAERARRRSVRFRNGVIAVLAVLTVAAAGSAAYAWHQLKTNEAFLDATLERFTSLVNRAVNSAQANYMPLGMTLGLLEEAEGILQVMASHGRETPKLKYRQAVMLRAFADNFLVLGRTADSARRVEAAIRIMTELVMDYPQNREFAAEKGWAHERSGNLLMLQNDLPGAQREFTIRHEIITRLIEANPGHNDQGHWQRDLIISHIKIGSVLSSQNKLAEALQSFQAAVAVSHSLVDANPDLLVLKDDLAASHDRVGNVLFDQGDLPGVLTSYLASQAIRERLAATDTRNRGYKRGLLLSHRKIGEVHFGRGNLRAALESRELARKIAEQLVNADPDNAIWQHDLALMESDIAEVLATEGDVQAALSRYMVSRSIIERIAKSDPANVSWQTDLAISHDKIGWVLVAQGKLPAALLSYRAALAIREGLAKDGTNDTSVLRGLASSLQSIGDVLLKQGDPPAALESYRAGRAIAERLARADPSNAKWQLQLASSLQRIGDVLVDQDLPAALKIFGELRDIVERLAALDPSNTEWQRTLAVSHEKMSDVLRAQRNLSAALESAKASHAITERLATSAPTNTGWQHDLSESHLKIGDVLADLGDLPGALDNHRTAIAIRERLVQTDVSNLVWQRDLAVSQGRMAAILSRQGASDAARAAFLKGRETLIRLREQSPSDASLLEHLASLEAKLQRHTIDEATKAGRYTEALRVQEQLVAETEAAEMKASGKPGESTADELINLAWLALLAGEPVKALAAAERALSLKPSQQSILTIDTNRAHALMYLGRAEEARALYLAHKDKPLPDSDNKPWQKGVAEDFSKLRNAGRQHSMMIEIEAALGFGPLR